MSITAQYELQSAADGAGVISGGALAAATFMPGGGHADATLSFWAYRTSHEWMVLAGNQGGGQARLDFGEAATEHAIIVTDDAMATDANVSDTADGVLDEWTHYAIVIDQSGLGQLRFYKNGVILAGLTLALASWTPRTVAATWIGLYLGAVAGAAFKNLHVHDLALTAAQLLAITAATHSHNLRIATGAWTLLDPGIVAWEIEAAGAYVPNTGTGGACTLYLETGDLGVTSAGVGNALITASYQRLVAGGAAVEATTNLAARTLVPVGTDGIPSGGTVSWWEWQPSTVEEGLRLGSASEPTMVMSTADGADVDFFDDNDVLDQNINAGDAPVYGSWVHFAVAFDPEDFKGKVYRNGVLIGSAVL